MTGEDQSTTVGPLPETGTEPGPRTPAVLTRLAWLLWLGSLGPLAARLLGGGPWTAAGVVAVDGLTVVTWTVVTLLGGLVHSYSRRYMAGSRDVARFFGRVFGFTLTVLTLVAADHVALFALAWLAMGLLMASLIGYARGWPQARAAARLARRYFLASTALLAVGLGALWWTTGEPTVSGIATAGGALRGPVVPVAAGALLLAAMVQSALLPFHTWLLSSMTAPTPASALMHAGFVNAGGLLLARFAPVLTVDPTLMALAVVAGAASALLGKFLKSVRADVKGQLCCSTVAQMGFMIMQAGLGFFGAAVTHLLVHGFYKAYLFLSSGERIERTAPGSDGDRSRGTGLPGTVVTVLTAVAGGAVFAGLTGKGTSPDGGLVLTLLVVVLVLHATREVVRRRSLPVAVRYGAVPLIGLPAIAVYAAVYVAVTGLMSGPSVVTAPVDLRGLHGVVAAAFVLGYGAVETGVYLRSRRLYVALVNAGQPPADTVLTDPEAYDEY